MLLKNKIRIFVCFVLFEVTCISFAQVKFPSPEEMLQQLKGRNDIKVTEIEKGIIKLQYPNRKTILKNINEYKPPEQNTIRYSPTYDSTIINLITIDTLPYYRKYGFWQEVPIHNWQFDFVRVGDVNNNGKYELYGCKKLFNSDLQPINIYEMNYSGTFEFKYQYDSVANARNIYDVNKDGQQEVFLTASALLLVPYEQRVFSKSSDTSLATELNFIFYFEDQLNNQTLGNLDGDSFTDLLFVGFSKVGIYIYEYNPVVNNFDSVYHFTTSGEYAYGGFSIGDFDHDGKTDMVCATMEGNVYVIENEGDNQYINSWQGMVETYNAYIHTWTNDTDKNGKPEFWVLGDAFYYGVPITRITLFETDGDNSYQAVGRIDLIGIFSFSAGNMQTVDVDNDGTDEVAVCIDGNFLILRFNGSRNHQTYEIYYIKQPAENEGYMGAIMADLLDDSEMEILISMGNPNKVMTRIYKPASATSVYDNNKLPETIKLYQNYPNPFNPSTNIKFDLIKADYVSIKVYNILGKEVKSLLNRKVSVGEHKVQWNGKDNNNRELPSGIYLIKITAGSYQKTIKAILLK
jgi:hypothetical protein